MHNSCYIMYNTFFLIQYLKIYQYRYKYIIFFCSIALQSDSNVSVLFFLHCNSQTICSCFKWGLMRGGYEIGTRRRRRIICCYLWMFQEEIDQAVHWRRFFKIIHNTYDIEINTSFCSSIWHDTFGTWNQRFFNSIKSISLALSVLFFVHSLSLWIVCLLFCNFTRELTSQQPIIIDWWCSATVLRSIQKRLRTHSLLLFFAFFFLKRFFFSHSPLTCSFLWWCMSSR